MEGESEKKDEILDSDEDGDDFLVSDEGGDDFLETELVPYKLELVLPNKAVVKAAEVDPNHSATVKWVKMAIIKKHYPVDKFQNPVNPDDHELVLEFPMGKAKVLDDGRMVIDYEEDIQSCERMRLQCAGLGVEELSEAQMTQALNVRLK